MKQIAMVLGMLFTAAVAAQAQGRAPAIPRDHRPPAGMCRIWLQNVPPSQQPAPTDCATAVRNRPANGRVIFGDDYVQPQRKKDDDRAGTLLRNFVHPMPFAAEHPKDDRKPAQKREPKKKPDGSL